METHKHDLSHLFRQLGYTGSPEDIENFIVSHPLAKGISLPDASFWTAAQSHFLRHAISEDADWSEAVDELSVRLSK